MNRIKQKTIINISEGNKKFVFFGCNRFSYKCIKYFLESHEIITKGCFISEIIINQSDLLKNKLILKKIVLLAFQHNISIKIYSEKLGTHGDIGLSLGFSEKIDKRHIECFKNGIINYHFAPLPLYRGVKTLSHAIINGEKKFAITSHYIDTGIDTGPIIEANWINIDETTSAKKINISLERVAFSLFKKQIEFLTEHNVLPSVDQKKIINVAEKNSKYFNRKSLEKYYKINKDWHFEKIFKITRALTLTGNKLPYIEENGKRIYLQVK